MNCRQMRTCGSVAGARKAWVQGRNDMVAPRTEAMGCANGNHTLRSMSGQKRCHVPKECQVARQSGTRLPAVAVQNFRLASGVRPRFWCRDPQLIHGSHAQRTMTSVVQSDLRWRRGHRPLQWCCTVMSHHAAQRTELGCEYCRAAVVCDKRTFLVGVRTGRCREAL